MCRKKKGEWRFLPRLKWWVSTPDVFMKQSRDLTRQNTCANFSNIDVRNRNDVMVRALVQKDIVKWMIFGESIPDVEAELAFCFEARGFKFENEKQKQEVIPLMASRINKMVDYFRGPYTHDAGYPNTELLSPSDFADDAKVIDYFGEQLHVNFDFVRVCRDTNGEVRKVNIGKITTSRYPGANSDTHNLEVYALGQFGRNQYPMAEVSVDVCHLRGKRDGDDITYNCYNDPTVTSIHIDAHSDRLYETMHEVEEAQPHVCSGNDCAGCFKANICHFEEAPVASDVEKIVRPLGDIRLSAEQEQVINFGEGFAKVNAGAGAGKTLTVALRIKRLFEMGVDPHDVALLTFTRAGADEMIERVKVYCDNLNVDVDAITAATFNSFCEGIIAEHFEELGYTQEPKVISEELKCSIINDILNRRSKISNWNYSMFTDGKSKLPRVVTDTAAIKKANRIFSEIKFNNWTRDNHGIDDTPDNIMTIFSLYDEYNNELKKNNLMEFDDQIRAIFKLGEMDRDFFDKLLPADDPAVPNTDGQALLPDEVGQNAPRKGYKYIIVDEFQDTDFPQILLLQKLVATPSFKGIMVVGDDSQAIYGFRHTSPEYILNFNRYFGNEQNPVHEFHLLENHRSTKSIVDFANKVNDKAISKVDKELRATKGAGDPVVVKGFYSTEDEYKFIVDSIKADVEAGINPSSIAFLSRDNEEVERIASLLSQTPCELVRFDENGVPVRDENGEIVRYHSDSIPSVIVNNVPYQDNSRVKAICTFYQSWKYGTTQGFLDYANAKSHGSLKGVDDETLISIKDRMQMVVDGTPHDYEHFISFAERLDPHRKDDLYQAFLDKIKMAVNIDPSRNDLTALENFFRDFNRYGSQEKYRREGNYEGVCLTTAHSSKGLEWDKTYVTVTRFDTLKNHQNGTQSANYTREYIDKHHDEDIRLMFVAGSRARENLVITGNYLVASKDKYGARYIKNKMLQLCFEAANVPYTFSVYDQMEYERSQEAAVGEVDQIDRLIGELTTDDPVLEAVTRTTEAPTRGRRGGRRAQEVANTPTGVAGHVYVTFEDGHTVDVNDNIRIEEAISAAESESQDDRADEEGGNNHGNL